MQSRVSENAADPSERPRDRDPDQGGHFDLKAPLLRMALSLSRSQTAALLDQHWALVPSAGPRVWQFESERGKEPF